MLFLRYPTTDVGHLGQLSFMGFRPWSDQLAQFLRTPCDRAEPASPCPTATSGIPTWATPDQGLGIEPSDHPHWLQEKSPMCSAPITSLSPTCLSFLGLQTQSLFLRTLRLTSSLPPLRLYSCSTPCQEPSSLADSCSSPSAQFTAAFFMEAWPL